MTEKDEGILKEIKMKTEYEAKFVNIEPETIVSEIIAKGGVQSKERTLMRRCTFDIPGAQRGTFVRVRDEGSRTTLTYKNLRSLEVSGMGEIEVKVDDFEQAVELCKAIGLQQATYEENYRTAYHMNNAEITVDEWPALPPFIEIEGETEEVVRATAQQLNLKMEDALFGNVDEVYRKLKNIEISQLKTITFDHPIN